MKSAPVILGIVSLNFIVLQLLPGDAADAIAGMAGSATEEGMQDLRERYGLNLPVLVQLKNYLVNLAHLELGRSFRYNVPVFDLIMSRLPATLLLMVSALVLSIVLGVAAGMAMARWEDRWPDRVLSVVALLFYSLPAFWVGLMAIILFSVKLRWLPSGGLETIGSTLEGWRFIVDRARHMILPTLALGSFYLAIYARLTRASVIEIKSQEFVRTAVAKGLHPATIAFRHVLRNALVPVSTVAGLHLGGMLGGAVVIEVVFGWPGMGSLALDAVIGRDFNVLLGIFLLSSLIVILANILVDLLQMWLDPRIQENRL